jgi:hypothetical protein
MTDEADMTPATVLIRYSGPDRPDVDRLISAIREAALEVNPSIWERPSTTEAVLDIAPNPEIARMSSAVFRERIERAAHHWREMGGGGRGNIEPLGEDSEDFLDGLLQPPPG